MVVPFMVQADDFDSPKMEADSVELNAGVGVTLESGSTTVGGSWTSVSFKNTGFTNPVVVASHIEKANSFAVSVRIRNVNSSGFEVKLQAPNGSIPEAETVTYIAVEKGKWFIDGYKIEAASDNIPTIGASPTIGGSWKAEKQEYLHTYAEPPVVLHQVQTANDESWVTSWVSKQSGRSSPPTKDGFQAGLNGAEVTTSHSEETIGWIVVESDSTGTIGGVKFNAQRTKDLVYGHDNEQNCETFNYATVNSSTSVPIVSQLEMDGNDGSWAVICAKNNSSLGLHVEEDDVYDDERTHTTEWNGFIVFESPVSANRDIEPGWTTVEFQQSYDSPVVIAMPYVVENDMPISVRIRNVNSTSAEFALQSSSGALGFDATAYYMVIEEGAWKMGHSLIEAHKETVSTVAASESIGGKWIGANKSYTHTYETDPLVFHQVMSFNDEDWITTWVSKQGDRQHRPTTDGFQIALNGAQVTTEHGAETVGWVVVEENAADEYSDVAWNSIVNTNSVQGHDEECTKLSFGGSFGSPVGFGTQLKMEGIDGGWLVMCYLDSGSIGLYVEEDQEKDTERSHTVESVGFIVFEKGFVADGTEEPAPICYEIGGDNKSNDGDKFVDEFNTLKYNCEHPLYSTFDPKDGELYEQSVQSVVGSKKGKFFVTYSDNSVYRFEVYKTKSKRKTRVLQYVGTGYVLVIDPYAKRIAIVNVYDGQVLNKIELFRGRLKRKYFDFIFELVDLHHDGYPEAVIIAKRLGERVRMQVVNIRILRSAFGSKTTNMVYDKNIRPKKTKFTDNRIKLKHSDVGEVLYRFDIDSRNNEFKLVE